MVLIVVEAVINSKPGVTGASRCGVVIGRSCKLPMTSDDFHVTGACTATTI